MQALRCSTLTLWAAWIAAYWQGGRGLVAAVKEARRTKSATTDTATTLGIVLPSALLVTTGILHCRGRLAGQPCSVQP